VMIDDGSGAMEMEDTMVDVYAVHPQLQVGDMVTEVVGVMDFGYGSYEVEPRSAADVGGTSIMEIQAAVNGTEGECASFGSPYEGMAVNVSGVVTGVMYSGFFLQETGAVHAGIYVYLNAGTQRDAYGAGGYMPELGMTFWVSGTVLEYSGLSELYPVTDAVNVTVGTAHVTALQVSTGMYGSGCTAEMESYEGVLVEVRGAVASGYNNSDAGYAHFYVNDGGGAVKVVDFLGYDAWSSMMLEEGSELMSLMGVVHWMENEFVLTPRNADDVKVVPGSSPPPVEIKSYSIAEIQTVQSGIDGNCSSFASPVEGELVSTSGVVTVVQDGYMYFIEDYDGGAYSGVKIGSVIGTRVHAEGLRIPEPMNVTPGMFNHSAGCTAAAEMYEGVLTRFSGVKIESLRDEHGQVMLNDGSGAMEMEDTMVDIYAVHPQLQVGDMVTEVVGVMDFGYGSYEVEPRSAADVGGTSIMEIQAAVNGTEGECASFGSPYEGMAVNIVRSAGPDRQEAP
ncbi:hypothetical protein CYMTET_42086, partial [Cymbomonas tetramitiformis]